MHFDCEIEATDETIRRGIAGYKGKVLERGAREVIVRVWADNIWTDPQRFKPEEIKEL